MGICKRLVILKVQEWRTSDGMIHVNHTRTIAATQPQRLEQLDIETGIPGEDKATDR